MVTSDPETLGKRLPTSRSRTSRSCSSCSASSLNSWGLYSCDSPAAASTTTPCPPKSSGIPFSWEDQPGVPKHLQATAMNASLTESRHSLYVIGNMINSSLPPPPPGVSSKNRCDSVFASRKKMSSNYNQKVHDPFFMALVECSKDNQTAAERGDWHKAQKLEGKSRTGLLNLDRFQASCKTNVAVLESQVVLLRRPPEVLQSTPQTDLLELPLVRCISEVIGS